MNIGLYQNAAALEVNERMQALLAQNIASSSMAGYKQVGIGVEGVKSGKIPTQPGSAFSEVLDATTPHITTRRSMAQGELVRTGVQTDVAIRGDGFFRIDLPDGESILTRDGNLRLDAEARLVSRYGHPIAGENGAIQGQPNGGPISIGEDGSVIQGTQTLGKLAIFKVDSPDRLLPVPGGFYYGGERNLEPSENATIVPGFYEGSNVSGIRQMITMITGSRAAESSQTVIKTIDQAYDDSIRVLGQTSR